MMLELRKIVMFTAMKASKVTGSNTFTSVIFLSGRGALQLVPELQGRSLLRVQLPGPQVP